MSPLLDFRALSADYARYHTHPSNRLCHAVGIPLILFSLIRWTQGPATAWVPLLSPVLILYFLWDARLALKMTALFALMAAAGTRVSAGAAAIPFALGWILQLVGHSAFERNKPAFAANLLHLLVGPMWILKESA